MAHSSFPPFNHLTPMSDSHLISPYIITTELNSNIGNDHQVKKLLIVKQILIVSTVENVMRTVWRMYILILGCKGLTPSLPGVAKNEISP